VLTSGAPANVRATLEVGGIEEQVVVSSASEIVQTQSTTVSSTINTTQITKLPLTSRSAMDFVNFLPGVSTPGGNRDATINGLPRGVINITLDGVNVQDNTLRSTDGFFAIVSPRLDAIEEVTVTTANQGADAGQGAVQIKFVTRLWYQHVHGQRLLVLPQRRLECEHLVQQPHRHGKGQPASEPGRRSHWRPNRDSGTVRRPEQSLFLRQLRRTAAAERHDASAHDPQSVGDGGQLYVHRHGRDADRERARSRGQEWTPCDARSDDKHDHVEHQDRCGWRFIGVNRR
jgi:TonB-dependent Receptor Plug Domain